METDVPAFLALDRIAHTWRRSMGEVTKYKSYCTAILIDGGNVTLEI